MTIVPFPPQTKVDYPEADGKPIAETLQHVLVITHLLGANSRMVCGSGQRRGWNSTLPRGGRPQGCAPSSHKPKRLGVCEYFVYDVEHQELDPALRGFRLVNEVYVPMREAQDGELYSEEMKLVVRDVGEALRLVNPETGEVLKTYSENQSQVQLEQERTEMERERAQAAEEENARLRAEIERLRGKQA